jgi:hypothetical protein
MIDIPIRQSRDMIKTAVLSATRHHLDRFGNTKEVRDHVLAAVMHVGAALVLTEDDGREHAIAELDREIEEQKI